MSAAKINGTTVTRLDGRASAPVVITESDVKDAAKLARMLGDVIAAAAELSRAWAPAVVDFEDVAVSTAGALVTLQHNMRGRVRWWVVDWVCATNVAPILRKSTTATTSDTLVLLSYVAGTATIRVEAAG